MIDTKVVGMNWIEIPAGNYTLVHARKSKCQIEISVRYGSQVTPLVPVFMDWQVGQVHIAPP